MERHGINAIQRPTSVSAPNVAASGIPFVPGRAPVHTAATPAKAGVPVLCINWDDAVKKLGYSDDWKKYTLCEFMYSHFKLFEMGPVLFCNMLDTNTMKTAVAAKDSEVTDHKVKLPFEAINDNTLIVKAAGGTGNAYKEDTDYTVYYGEKNLFIELYRTEPPIQLATLMFLTARSIQRRLQALQSQWGWKQLTCV